jgi:hypothetical protein
MQVVCQVQAELFSEFGSEWSWAGESLDQFPGDVFAIRSTPSVSAEKDLVAGTEAGEHGFASSGYILPAGCQFGPSLD